AEVCLAPHAWHARFPNHPALPARPSSAIPPPERDCAPHWRGTPRSPCRSAKRCASCPDQLPADQETADLVGARPDVVKLGVAQETLHRPVLGIARAAQGLD